MRKYADSHTGVSISDPAIVVETKKKRVTNLEGSFSALWKMICSSKYWLGNVFQYFSVFICVLLHRSKLIFFTRELSCHLAAHAAKLGGQCFSAVLRVRNVSALPIQMPSHQKHLQEDPSAIRMWLIVWQPYAIVPAGKSFASKLSGWRARSGQLYGLNRFWDAKR